MFGFFFSLSLNRKIERSCWYKFFNQFIIFFKKLQYLNFQLSGKKISWSISWHSPKKASMNSLLFYILFCIRMLAKDPLMQKV